MFDFRRSLSYASACSESEIKYAVDVQNIVFGYKQNVKIINKLTIKILEGKIFALLGSNGSGKTTLLRLILGRLKPRSGSIRIFGNRPGTGYSDVPGSGVGYMPQQNGLLPELTINETLCYYSVLYQLNETETELRIKEFTEMWELVEKDRLIEELDQDHQRLVSLGVCLLHRPRLLILDEPTVAVDSEIRSRVWDKLEQICNEFGTTVLITTHCLEEARNAHTVGFAYSGKCLKYGTPDELMRQYRKKTLEGIYFDLVRDFISKSKESFKYVLEEEENKFIRFQDILSKCESEDKLRIANKSFDFQHIKALMWRSGKSVIRRPKALYLYLLIPIILICLINLCFGRPQNIPIGIYNSEEEPKLSKAFIDKLDDRLFHKTNFQSIDSSYDSVVNGKNYLSLIFDENFTQNLYHRLLEPNITTEDSLNSSHIRMYVDTSNPIITYFTQINIIQTFHNLVNIFWHLIGRDPAVLTLPIKIFGQFEGSYDHFLCPGLVLACVQFLNTLITTYYAFNLISERKTAFPERSLVAGVTHLELLFAQSLLVFILIICQSLIIAVMLLLVYNYPLSGNFFDFLLLLILQGLQGMTFGTTIALIFKNFIPSAYAIGLISIFLWLTSGIFWPLESTYPFLQFIGQSSSLGASILSLRYIMFRGWTLLNSFQLICGYLKLIAYIIVFSIINKLLLNKV